MAVAVPSARADRGPGVPLMPAAEFRTTRGQQVDLDIFGQKVPGVVLRPSLGSAVIEVRASSQVHRLRLGVQVTAVFAVPNGAAQVSATLGQAHDGVVLRFSGSVRLINRRRHPRAEIVAPVDLLWRDGCAPHGQLARASTLDLSEGGAQLQLATGSARPAPGTLVLLNLHLPDGPVELAGRILDVPGATVRVEFGGVVEADAARVGSLVNQILLQPSTGA